MITRKLSLFLLLLTLPGLVLSQDLGCFAPARPFVPSDPRDVQTYSGLIRQDFEKYVADFEVYLRCLDTERVRVFEEGQAVIQEYARFLDLIEGLGRPDLVE